MSSNSRDGVDYKSLIVKFQNKESRECLDSDLVNKIGKRLSVIDSQLQQQQHEQHQQHQQQQQQQQHEQQHEQTPDDVIRSTDDCSIISLLNQCSDVLRCLRNICVECETAQNMIVGDLDSEIVSTVCRIIDNISSITRREIDRGTTRVQSSEEAESVVKCGLQFLSNLSTRNESSSGVVWGNMKYDTIMDCLTYVGDNKVIDYMYSLLYNLYLSNQYTIVDCINNRHCSHMITSIVTRVKHDQFSKHPWGILLLEMFVKNEEFMLKIFATLCPTIQIFILDIVSNIIHDTNIGLSMVPIVSYLCDLFLISYNHILTWVDVDDDDSNEERYKALFVSKLLNTVAQITSNNALCSSLRENQIFLQTITELFQQVYKIGNSGSNIFTNVREISPTMLLTPAGGEGWNHPVDGLKSDIIRIIANLCYKHSINQNKIRESGVIPLILNHTKIDGRNPFITQWSVYAVRNLCDNNLDNQSYINSLKLEGMEDTSQMGDLPVTCELEDGKLRIKPSPR